ncbi:hypothetical protein Bca4012_068127 [Brassica carinata]
MRECFIPTYDSLVGFCPQHQFISGLRPLVSLLGGLFILRTKFGKLKLPQPKFLKRRMMFEFLFSVSEESENQFNSVMFQCIFSLWPPRLRLMIWRSTSEMSLRSRCHFCLLPRVFVWAGKPTWPGGLA